MMLDPKINVNGVSKYSIYLYKFIIYEYISWHIFNALHIILLQAQPWTDKGQIPDDEKPAKLTPGYYFKFTIVVLMTITKQMRSLFASLVHLAILYEWITLVLIITREHKKSIAELLYDAQQISKPDQKYRLIESSIFISSWILIVTSTIIRAFGLIIQFSFLRQYCQLNTQIGFDVLDHNYNAFLIAKGIWLGVVTISIFILGPTIIFMTWKLHYNEFKKHGLGLILFAVGMMIFTS